MNEEQKKYLEEFIKEYKVVEKQEDWNNYESVNIAFLENLILNILKLN